MAPVQKRVGAGTPTGGQFANLDRVEAGIELADIYDTDTLPLGVRDDFTEVDVFVFDGVRLRISTDGDDQYQVWSDDQVEEFWGEDELPKAGRGRLTPEARLRIAAARVHTAGRAGRAEELARQHEEEAFALTAEAERLRAMVESAPAQINELDDIAQTRAHVDAAFALLTDALA